MFVNDDDDDAVVGYPCGYIIIVFQEQTSHLFRAGLLLNIIYTSQYTKPTNEFHSPASSTAEDEKQIVSR